MAQNSNGEVPVTISLAEDSLVVIDLVKQPLKERSRTPSPLPEEEEEEEQQQPQEEETKEEPAKEDDEKPTTPPPAEATEEDKPAEPEQEKPATPTPEEDKPAEPEEEKPAEPEAEEPVEPEAEKPAEPEEKPVEPEAEEATEPEEKPAEPEAEPEEKPAEPEEKPAEPEEDKPAEPEAEESKKEGEGEEEKEPEREPTPLPGVPISYGLSLRLMQVGSDLKKVKSAKKFFTRIYTLEEDMLYISWNSSAKKSSKARIAISAIKEVQEGRKTQTFKAHGAAFDETCCFSIVYMEGTKYKTLDLVAATPNDANAWVEGLRALIKIKDSDEMRSKVREKWLQDLFSEADKNDDGTLDLSEVLVMLRRLNVGIHKKVIKQKFKEADKEGNTDEKLDFQEFCRLFKQLSARPELKRLFDKYSSRNEWLTPEDLGRFIQSEQGEEPSPAHCRDLIQRYEPTEEGKVECLMSFDGFTQFMLGPENDIFSQSHRRVHQDMGKPLSHYFIASSHNTYLLGDQLRSESSVDAYKRALLKGCRCVELDCWDGDNDEPIIYHGYTLTSKILFKDVIEGIKSVAFTASEYPVILSLENHCSVAQQNKMAEHMEAIFGDMLYTGEGREEGEDCLPSPESLKGKILLKGKKLPKEVEDQDEGEVSDEDEAAEIDPADLKKAGIEPKPEPKAEEVEPKQEEAEPKQEEAEAKEEPKAEEPKTEEAEPKAEEAEPKTEEAEPKTEEAEPKTEEAEPKTEEAEPKTEEAEPKTEEAEPKTEEAEPKTEEAEPKTEEADPKKESTEAAAAEGEDETDKPAPKKRTFSFRRKSRHRQQREGSTSSTSGPQKKKIKLSARLSKLIFLHAIHFKGFDSESKGKSSQMSSFGEHSSYKHASTAAAKFIAYNKHQLSRVYPKGSRVDSSNYDPVPMWNCGSQIVALNYQTQGKMMDVNLGKFQQNGGCGYVLKPSIMRDEFTHFDQSNRREVPGACPKFVTISVISGQHLPKPEGGSKSGEVIDPYVVLQTLGVPVDCHEAKTKVISDNGFNPVWNEVFEFPVLFPELLLLRMKVMDSDWGPNKDDFVGQYSLPLTSMECGYRHIHLKTSLGDPLPNASIFVHVEVRDFVASPTKAPALKLKLKKSREYPEPQLVGFGALDTQFKACKAHVHKSVDLREDYVFACLMFKDSCGLVSHAIMKDCVELMTTRAFFSGLSFFLDVLGENAEHQVYSIGLREEGRVPPSTLHKMMDAFNHLNLAIRGLLTSADDVSAELDKVITSGKEQQDDLKQHLQKESVTKRVQSMEHFSWTLMLLQSECDLLKRAKENAETTLKKLFEATQKYNVELKTSL